MKYENIKVEKSSRQNNGDTVCDLEHIFDISLTEICEKIKSDDYIGLKMEFKVQDLWAEI